MQMAKVSEFLIPPSSGIAIKLLKTQYLKVIDPEGEQVSDFFCYSLDDLGESLSSGRSIDYNDTIYLTESHKLYSNRSRVMATIVKDTVKRHDFLLSPCSREMCELFSKTGEVHSGCFENLVSSLKTFGISSDSISTTLNIFMNVSVKENGQVVIDPPKSKPGDYLLLQAAMDLAVGVTACADKQTNNGRLKPIRVEIYE